MVTGLDHPLHSLDSSQCHWRVNVPRTRAPVLLRGLQGVAATVQWTKDLLVEGPLQSHPRRSALLTAGHLAGPALTTPAASLALAMGRQDRLPTWLDRH